MQFVILNFAVLLMAKTVLVNTLLIYLIIFIKQTKTFAKTPSKIAKYLGENKIPFFRPTNNKNKICKKKFKISIQILHQKCEKKCPYFDTDFKTATKKKLKCF